ncbi:MAG: pca operon transcription factor PcaQ [Salaquimonas sp.]|jgi:LysR family pca operon transcriptional activator|nr:pca operon transcription factor PcaQ [Salaquimonas sp.]
MNSLSNLKLRHLETFVEVARQKSVSRAAENLAVTQPAVTRTLRELERICGCALVEREGRGIRITQRGEMFLRHAAGSLASARAALNTIDQLGADDGPAIRVGALPTVSATRMPAAVNRYFVSGMRARLKIVSGDNHVLLDQLRNGELDFVMGRLPAPENMAGLVFEPFYRDRVVFVVHSHHELAGRDRIAAEDFDRFPVLLPPEGSIIQPFVDRLFIELGFARPRNVVETVSDSFGKAYLRRYPAIWIISRGVVSGELDSGEFALLAIDTSSTLGSVGLVTRAGSELPAPASFFAELLRGLTAEGEGAEGQNGRPV